MITRGRTAINNNIENQNPERVKSVSQKSIFKSTARPVLSSLTNNNVKQKPNDVFATLDLSDQDLDSFKQFIDARLKYHSKVAPEEISSIFKDYEGTEYEDVNFAYLQNLEYTLLPIGQKFLDKHTISPRMRYILVNWLVKIHEAHHMVAETLYLTVAIMDRYLQYSSTPVSKVNFQLLGMTALFIASKYEETYPPEICDLVACTDYLIDKKDIKDLECTILNTLGFEVDFPLPISYLRRLTTYLNVDRTTHNMAKYFLELTIQEYDICWLTGNMRSAIAVCLAATIMGKKTDPSQVWDVNLEALTGFSYSQLEEHIVTLARVIYRQNSHSEYRAIKNKYATKDVNMKVASLPILNSSYFEKIARLEFDEAGNPI